MLLPQPLALSHRPTAADTELHGKVCSKTSINFTPAESSEAVAASLNIKFAFNLPLSAAFTLSQPKDSYCDTETSALARSVSWIFHLCEKTQTNQLCESPE